MRKEDSKKEAAKKQLKNYQMESKLCEMYEKKKMTTGEIAKKFSVSR